MRKRGIDLDVERLERDARIERDRSRADFATYRNEVESAAFVLKRARRTCELEEAAWRRSPNSDSLRRAKAAQDARRAAEQELRAACDFDEEMVTNAKLKYGR
jgi:hypothetical protein